MGAMFEVGDILSKIRIKITIKNNETNYEYETDAILKDNILKYLENNNTKVLYNYDKNHLTRINEELRMEFKFDKNNKTKGIVTVHDINKEIPLTIKTNNIERINNNIVIDYSIENDQFLYKIEELL